MNLWNQLHRYFSYESNLGTDPVGSTLLRLSLPSIFMMFMNTLLHIVDTIFVSWLGEIPMAAMSFTLAIQILVFALLEGVGAGTTALVGRKLGEGKQRVAVGMATSGLFLAYCVCLPLLPLIFPSVSDAVFSRLGAEGQPELLRQCWLYNLWTPIIAPFIGFTFIIYCVFRCQGNTIVPLVCMMIANIVNMILDPIFIFVFDWGIAGAAIATLVGRLCAIYYLYYKMISSSQLVIPVFPKLELSLFKRWKDIIVVGFPVSLATGSVALGFGTINRILAGFGHHAVAAWMLGMRIEDFAFTVVMGVNAALTPFLAFNYGKKDYGRILQGMKSAAFISGSIMAVIGGFIFIFPHPFLALFRPSPATAELAVISIRTSITGYPFTITQFIFNALFVATGMSYLGTIAQLVRSVFSRIPAAHFFAAHFGIRGIWWFQPFSWLVGAAFALFFGYFLLRKIKKDFKKAAQETAANESSSTE